MKTYKNLYAKICERGNLELALDNASRRKKRIVKWCKEHRDKVIDKIQSELESETYHFRHHKPCIIYDGISRKKRTIITPDFNNEEIIHHAVIQILQPIIMKGMDVNCCASIPKRGCTYGKRKVEKFIRRNPKKCKYCLKMDIKQFFPSVNHTLLKNLICRKIKDGKFQRLLFTIIDNYEDAEDRGIPLGYYTSQWLANWYLQDLDHLIREKLGADFYIRYMDDMVIFGANKRELHQMKDAIEEYLNNELDLELNSKWQVFRFNFEYQKINGDVIRGGVFLDFMGYRFYRNRTTLRKAIMLKAIRKAHKIHKGRATWYSASQMMSYLSKFRETDTNNIYNRYIKGFVNIRELKQKISIHQRRLKDED